MANTRISDLAELITPPDDNDLLYVVDISDTSMAASGTSKKNQAQHYLRTNGTANTLGASINANNFNITGAGTVAASAMTSNGVAVVTTTAIQTLGNKTLTNPKISTLYGGTGSGGNITISSTSNTTKGKILIGTASVYDEANTRLGIGVVLPEYTLDVNGSFQCTQMGETWVNATYNTGWTDYYGTYHSVGYKKVGDLVYLRGTCKRISGSSSTIITLPSGYRPAKNVPFAASSNYLNCGIDIDSAGNVVLVGGSPTTWVSLEGIAFSTL